MIIVYTQSETQVLGAIQLLETINQNDKANLYVYDTSEKFEEYYSGKYIPILKKNALKVILHSLIFKCILVLGDDRKLHIFFQILFNIARKIYFVDDGLLSFWLFEKYQKQKNSKNVIIFTKYKNYIEAYYGVNSNNLLKQDFHIVGNKKHPGDPVVIIGGAYLSIGFINQSQYIILINNIASQFPDKAVHFIPHPRDLSLFLELENHFADKVYLIKSQDSFEKKISGYLKPGSNVVSFFSSALLDCKLMESNAIYHYVKLPGHSERNTVHLGGYDSHLLGFNVEARIYELYNQIGFMELKNNANK